MIYLDMQVSTSQIAQALEGDREEFFYFLGSLVDAVATDAAGFAAEVADYASVEEAVTFEHFLRGLADEFKKHTPQG